MTAEQAYQILGVRSGASRAAVEQAYTAALQAAQLRLVPGNPAAIRQKAQDQIAALKTAFEFLKNSPVPPLSPAQPGGYASPQKPPTNRFRAPPGGGGPAVSNVVILAGFALAAAVVLFIALACVRATAPDHKNGTAQLRVLSVPWSYVQVDGKLLGPSGQVDAFALKPGEHEVVLRHGDRVLSQTLHLPEHSETVIKAQLEKGHIDVEQKQI